MTFDLFVSRVIVPKRLEVIPATRNTDTNDACFIYLQKRSDLSTNKVRYLMDFSPDKLGIN